ncbi:Otogelin [Cricetulus griseus]|uniref:Otogelin n=1 Tax=Cricetulus griseus TaxID=10029 RepID=G3IEK0_CRIGR|nr:Otogelin [Cricetulus griseus]
MHDLLQQLSCAAFVPNMGSGRDGICKTWGQYHFETFDGIYYYFPGSCSYIFAKDCGNLEPQYTVWVHNSPKCLGSVYSCYRSISLFFSNQEEIRIYGHEIKMNGIRLSLPQTIGQVYIEKLADYILVKSTFGFSLAWDGISGIYLKLSEEHRGKSCGLCANYNGIQSDDFVIQQEDYTEDIAMFANSWMVQTLDDPKCIPTPSDFPNPCSSGMPAFEAIFFKCQILLQFPFLSCHEYIDPYLYIASCVNDLCKTDDDETYCRAATEYARACSHAGFPIQDWRDDFPACTDKCDDSFVHRDCISCCPPSCTFEKQCLGSNLHCLDGCYCADVQCSVVGDSHFTTFDGRHYSFIGLCQYILVKGTGKDKFTITLQKAHCEQNLGLVCLQSITLILEDDFNKQVTLSRGGQILTSPNQGFTLNGKKQSSIVEIQTLSSLFILLRTTFGLKILFAIDGERIYIQLSSEWKRRTLGLCGTFNGNIRDDFLSPSGMIEGTPQLHAHAWRVSSTCFAPVHVPMVDPCNINQQNIGYAAHCDVIHQELFAPCHVYVSPGLYYQLCRHDACKCGSSCLCNALAHYAYLCGQRGVPIDFRAQISFCAVVCQKGMLYHHCSSFCLRSCTSLSSPEPCNDDCAEGCNCPEGKFYEDTLNFCVPIQCSNGTVKCDEPATPSTVCTVYGDRHYYSFDGLEYDYISDCQVFLIKSTDDTDISVIAQNKKCFDNDIVCSKSVLISIGDTEIYLNDAPYKQKRSGFFLESKPTYKLWKAGHYIVVYFPEEDITILWDEKTTIHIKVGPQWKNKLAGLCGNFDKCTSNDMTTSNNLEVRNAQVFGDSWALGQCEDPIEALKPCEAHQNKFPYAKKECSILYSRCSMLSELSIITFDGNSAALSSKASYILVRIPGEIVVVHIEKCSLNQVDVDSIVVPLPFSSQDLFIEDSGTIHIYFEGICNDDPDDDLRMQNGTVITNMEDIELFIGSWEVEKSFEVTMRRPVRNCTEYDCSHCIELLNRDVFILCRDKVSPRDFCEKMWLNYTYLWSYECDAISAYVALCNKFDICIQWRTPDYCRCTDNEDQPRSVGEIWNGGVDECALYKCLEDGSIIPVEPVCEEEPSPICEREAEVVMGIIDELTCCSKEVCGCDMTLCDKTIPGCTSSQKLIVGYSALSCCPQYECGMPPFLIQIPLRKILINQTWVFPHSGWFGRSPFSGSLCKNCVDESFVIVFQKITTSGGMH